MAMKGLHDYRFEVIVDLNIDIKSEWIILS